MAGGEGVRETADRERAFSAVACVCLVYVFLSVCVSVGLFLRRSLFAGLGSLSVRSVRLSEY